MIKERFEKLIRRLKKEGRKPHWQIQYLFNSEWWNLCTPERDRQERIETMKKTALGDDGDTHTYEMRVIPVDPWVDNPYPKPIKPKKGE